MNRRLERILFKLAQRHTPHLIPPGWQPSPPTLRKLARDLADYDLLVVMAYIPTHLVNDRDRLIQEWAGALANFHELLAQSLFPGYAHLTARYADEAMPPVVVFHAQVSPIVELMAGYLLPYISNRHQHARVPETEMQELMEVILARLAASDLPEPVYHTLVRDGVSIIQTLLHSGAMPVSLTDYDQPIFPDVPRPPDPPQTGKFSPEARRRAEEAIARAAGQAAAQPDGQRPAPASNGQHAAPAASGTAPARHQPARDDDTAPAEPVRPLEPFADADNQYAAGLTPTERMFVRPIDLPFKRRPPVDAPPGIPGPTGKKTGKA